MGKYASEAETIFDNFIENGYFIEDKFTNRIKCEREECERLFIVKPEKRFCSERCRKISEKKRQNRKLRENNPKTYSQSKDCAYCGNMINVYERANKIYCSDKCSKRAEHNRYMKRRRIKGLATKKYHYSKSKWDHIKKKYGLTQEQWENLFTMQGCKCKICGKNDPSCKKGWHTDHIELNNKILVRGILCMSCNTGIGKFYDDPYIMLRAIRYVKTNGLIGS